MSVDADVIILSINASLSLASAESSCWQQELGMEDTVSVLGRTCDSQEGPGARGHDLLGLYSVRA